MRTKAGEVRGDIETSTREKTEYAIFYGVPYARPPIGPFRLMAPQPLEPWEGVFDNKKSMSAVCLQKDALPWENVSEDCLYLTLATPAILNGEVLQDASLPVMVTIIKLPSFEIFARSGYMVAVGWLAVEVLLSTTQTSSWTRFYEQPFLFPVSGCRARWSELQIGSLGVLGVGGWGWREPGPQRPGT